MMNTRQIALQALEQYSIQVHNLRFLARESNIYYKVTTTGGESFVLRIYSDMETTLQDNIAELFWLKALTHDTDLCITEPIPDRTGRYLNLVQPPGDTATYRCALFGWVPGRSLSRYLTTGNYEKLGRLSAVLHSHAETLQIPSAIQPRRWDRVFYFPDEPDLIHDPHYRHLFPKPRVLMLDRVMGQAQKLLSELYESCPPILIHNDLHFWNVRVHKGKLCAMDFENVILGCPLQDVAVSLYYGMEREDYPDLSCAFEDGYTSQRRWPVTSPYQLETLWAARTLNFISYAARIDPDPRAYIKERCADLQAYLRRFG